MQSTPITRRGPIASESGQGALALVAVLGLILIAGFFGYRYMQSTGVQLFESSESMDRGLRHLHGLEYMHSFTPPAGGAVPEERAAIFEAVTTEAFAAMQGDLRKLRALDTGDDGDRPSLRETASGIGALGGVTMGLGLTLSEYDMALSEYLWTGLQLLRGGGQMEELWGPLVPPAPEAAVETASRHQAVLDGILAATADSVEGATPGTVYWMGWGMAQHSRRVWESPGVQAAAALIDSVIAADSTGSAGSTPPRDGSPTPAPPTK